ncbi:MAG: alpha/beta hydrolase [Chitinophagales bacterium]
MIYLLHGALGSSHELQPLANRLPFKTQLYTFSGHGRTPSQTHAATIQTYAHEVLQDMNARQIPQAAFFGYSMGGYVALWLARFYPERVQRVFTLGTKFHWNEQEAIKETSRLHADKIAEKVPAFANELAQRHGEQEWRSVLQKTAHLMHDLGKHHLLESDFNAITCPIILARAAHDTMVTKEETETAAQWLPKSQLITIPDSQHPIAQTNLEVLTRLVQEFFGSPI